MSRTRQKEYTVAENATAFDRDRDPAPVPGVLVTAVLPEVSAERKTVPPLRYIALRILIAAVISWASDTEASDLTQATDANASVDAAPAEICPAPNGCLTLSDALGLALSGNPSLKAFAWKLLAADAHTVQAGKRPNPRISVTADELRLGQGPKNVTQVLRYGEEWQGRERIEDGTPAGFSDAELTVGLSQELELGGKRAKRVNLAQKEREMRTQEYEVLRAKVTRDAKVLFYTLLALQEYANSCEEPLHCAENLVNKFRNAGFPLVEINAAEVMRSNCEMQRDKAQRQLEAARIRLAGTWGATQAQFERVTGNPDPEKQIPPKKELLELLSESPASGKYAALVESARAQVELERVNATPNLELRCAFRRDRIPDRRELGAGIGNGIEMEQRLVRSEGRYDNTVMIGFSIPLPLFDRKQGAIEEARDEFAGVCEERRAALLSAKTAVLSLREDLAASSEAISTLHHHVIPTISQTVEAVRNGMNAGTFAQLDLMKALNELHDALRQLMEVRIAYFEGQAAMEELIGRPLAEIKRIGTE